MMFIEEFDRLERRVGLVEEELRRAFEVLQYAESLDVVQAAAASGLEALKELEAYRPEIEPLFEPDFDFERRINEDDGA